MGDRIILALALALVLLTGCETEWNERECKSRLAMARTREDSVAAIGSTPGGQNGGPKYFYTCAAYVDLVGSAR